MLLTIDGDQATLHTRMTPLIMLALPRIEGHRRWLKGGGLRLEATKHNIEVLRESGVDLEISDPKDGQGAAFSDSPVGSAPYKWRTKPFDHQTAALEKCGAQKHFALFMEQGTGKTKVAIDHAGTLWAAGRITAVLVVAPKGVHRQWIDGQLPEHSGTDFTAACWPLKELPKNVRKGYDLKWLAINIDGAKTPRGMVMCEEFMEAHEGRVLMIVDESHMIKNARSKRWKAVKSLGRRAAYRMMLTGTPIAKDLTEEWAQFKWLDENIIGIRYLTAFRNEYCIMGGFELSLIHISEPTRPY